MMNRKLMAGGVAQGNNSVTVRSVANKMVGKIKKVPAVERVSGFLTRAKHGLTMKKNVALVSMFLLCGGAGSMVGCGADNPLSSGSEVTQDRDITGKVIAYVDANGELATGKVVADHGNILDMGGFELSQSEILGTATVAGSFDPITLAKGRHLDAYGDQFADIEYLHGMVEEVFVSRNASGESETKAALVNALGGTTASGKEIVFRDAIGEDLYILVRRSDYWYD